MRSISIKNCIDCVCVSCGHYYYKESEVCRYRKDMRCGLCKGRHPRYFCDGEIIPVDIKETLENEDNSNIIEEEL